MPKSKTILLVEDEDAVRELAAKVLHQAGYDVFKAVDCGAALALWKMHGARIDLLLTDMVLPGEGTGQDLAEQLLREKPDLKVIYSSGYSGDVVGQVFAFPERVHFLQKPYAPQALAQAVRDCLEA